MHLSPLDSSTVSFVKTLYMSAFPLEERKPFSVILRKQRKNLCEILVIKDGDIPVGFFVNAVVGGAVLVDYFAVDGNARSKGYGSKALDLLKQQYIGKKIVLEIERIDETSQDNDLKTRRKNFYIKNGFCETGMYTKLVGVDMEILSFGGTIGYDEFIKIYDKFMGRFFRSLFVKKIDR